MRARAAAAPLAAYVLHQYDWSESSLIVELFTRDAWPCGGGRARAPSGRPIRSCGQCCMPFQRLAVAVSGAARDEASAEVRNLRSAEWAGGARCRGGDALLAGFYLNELLLRLLARRRPPSPAVRRLCRNAAATWHRRRGACSCCVPSSWCCWREIGHLPDLSSDVTSTAEGVAGAAATYTAAARGGPGGRRRPTPLGGSMRRWGKSAFRGGGARPRGAACCRRRLRSCAAAAMRGSVFTYHLAGAHAAHSRMLGLRRPARP
jgi:DNA repair protein RecO (recombination protein O)